MNGTCIASQVTHLVRVRATHFVRVSVTHFVRVRETHLTDRPDERDGVAGRLEGYVSCVSRILPGEDGRLQGDDGRLERWFMAGEGLDGRLERW